MFLAQINADLCHGVDYHGIDLIGGRGPCGADFDGAAGQSTGEGGGHLGAPGVVNTDEHDGRTHRFGHERLLCEGGGGFWNWYEPV